MHIIIKPKRIHHTPNNKSLKKYKKVTKGKETNILPNHCKVPLSDSLMISCSNLLNSIQKKIIVGINKWSVY